MTDNFDNDLARVLQIRRAQESARPTAANPAWLNAHADCNFLLSFIDKLWAEYSRANSRHVETASVADYEAVLADHRRLVRDLDVYLNGAGAAPQASLCDIVSQVAAAVRAKGSCLFSAVETAAPEIAEARAALGAYKAGAWTDHYAASRLATILDGLLPPVEPKARHRGCGPDCTLPAGHLGEHVPP